MKHGKRSESPSPWKRQTAGHIKKPWQKSAPSLEKKPGSALFHRTIKASSAPAALNGIACLIREYASITGKTPIQILAVLATVMTFPTIQDQQKKEEDE